MLSTVAEGQTIAAEAAAYPGVPFRGTISTISPIVDPQTRSVMIRARLPNPDLRLRPGMWMTVSIEASPPDRLGVPELAVVSERPEARRVGREWGSAGRARGSPD